MAQRLDELIDDAFDSTVARKKSSKAPLFLKAKYEYTKEREVEFRNIPVKQLIRDKYFMGRGTSIYPKNESIIIDLFEARKQRNVDLFVYLAGIGSGKTFVAAAIL